jgi:hypothetical protein
MNNGQRATGNAKGTLMHSPLHVARCALLLILSACSSPGTGHLQQSVQTQLAGEGIVRRADDQQFRYTYYSRSTRGNRWEERDASIIVTRARVYIFKNEKVGLDLDRDSRKKSEVRREGDRIVIAAGSGQSRVSWAFRPPDDADGWVRDIRTALADSTTP